MRAFPLAGLSIARPAVMAMQIPARADGWDPWLQARGAQRNGENEEADVGLLHGRERVSSSVWMVQPWVSRGSKWMVSTFHSSK